MDLKGEEDLDGMYTFMLVLNGASSGERLDLTRNCDVALKLTILNQCMVRYGQSPCVLWFLVSLVGLFK